MVPSVRQLIGRKREGHALSTEELRALAEAVGNDAQAEEAFAEIGECEWSQTELVELARAMVGTIELLDLSEAGRPLIDQWSTGGVADEKTSLVVGPLAAACGLAVPMVFGEGQGGGSGLQSKLSAITGFRCALSASQIARQVRDIGLAMVVEPVGIQWPGLRCASLDMFEEGRARLPLLVGGTLPEKIAENLDGLVLNVKFGPGALVRERECAHALALLLASIARALDCPAVAVVSSTDEPLGRALGPIVELEEAIQCLHCKGPVDLEEFCVSLVGEMIAVAFPDRSPESGREQAQAALADGSALNVFRALIAAQGGDPGLTTRPVRLPEARHSETVNYIGHAAGWVRRVDARLIAEAATLLAAGDRRKGEPVDPTVGVTELIKVGAKISVGTPLARLHFNDDGYCPCAHDLLRQAIEVSSEAPVRKPFTFERVAVHELRSQL